MKTKQSALMGLCFLLFSQTVMANCNEQTIVIETIPNQKQELKGQTYKASMYVDRGQQQVMEVLLDSKRYPEFLDDVSAVNIQQTSSTDVIIEEQTLSLPLKKLNATDWKNYPPRFYSLADD